jgi:hypothetical protein
VGGVADEEQSRQAPLLEPIHCHGQQLDVVQAADIVDPIAVHQLGNPRTKCLDARGLDRVAGALADDQGALPVIAAVEHHQCLAALDAAQGQTMLRSRGYAKPEHVHRGSDVGHLEA